MADRHGSAIITTHVDCKQCDAEHEVTALVWWAEERETRDYPGAFWVEEVDVRSFEEHEEEGCVWTDQQIRDAVTERVDADPMLVD